MALMMSRRSATTSAAFVKANTMRVATPLRAAASGRRSLVCRAHTPKPLVGNVAPDFTAQAVFDQEFIEVQLSKYRGKYVVLFFYPLDFTFVCPTEITA